VAGDTRLTDRLPELILELGQQRDTAAAVERDEHLGQPNWTTPQPCNWTLLEVRSRA